MNSENAGTNLMEASHQWATRPPDQRFETIEALRDNVNARRMRCRSVDVDYSRLDVAENHQGKLVVNSELAPCEPTHWSFGQLAASVKAPAGYLRTLPLPIVLDALRYGLKNSEREEGKFMTISRDDTSESPNILQAVTSTTYGRIWDADVIDSVIRVNERTGNRFYNPKAYAVGQYGMSGSVKPSGLYASDHDVFIFMIDGGSLLDVGERAQLNRGFITWNSETGAKTFGLMTFLFNKCCGNHIIWGAKDINQLIIRHTSGGPYRFDSQAAPALKAYVESSDQTTVDAIRKAQAFALPFKTDTALLTDALEWTAKHGKFTRSEVTEAIRFAKSEEGECGNLWQYIQGFTAYARGFEYIDARVDLEKRAGKLLNLVGDPSLN